ncbi:YihY family inner membrane protein [Azospira restricta]|uniref:YihY family inner membrane protein n=1 Tax=Azospira restricta TaxID=404405 RepID=A0A974PY33_9RHOO|nr:YihY family inner membrane protein [Azospira restricta]QRJ63451.1 YihY family inner membrane protein [Azospira restricta]
MAASRSFLFPFLVRICRRFGEEDFDQISASLAFTTLISLVPLAALILAMVSAVPAFASFVDHVDKLLVAHLLPAGSAGLISGKLLQFSKRAAEVSAFGVAVLVVTAFLLMNTVERAFNHVWRVRAPRPLWHRLALYAIVVVVWPVFIGALLAATSSALTASFGLLGELRWMRAPLFKLLSLAVLILFFAFLYHAVPNAPVRWRHAFTAGGFAALGFLLLQKAFELYLGYFPSYKAIYGAFAAVPIFLLWVYLSWAVVLVGGLVAATLPEFAPSPPRHRRRRVR